MDKSIVNFHYNKGIQSFGENLIMNIINEFSTYYDNISFVSVGSGLGGIEYSSNQLYNDINWICIDPDPNNYHSNKTIQPFIKPQYNYCDDLIRDKPEIVGNCILFLNWCEPNNSRYDYDAIIALKPLGILTIYELFYEENGAAGGELFFNHLIKNNLEYNMKRSLLLSPYSDDNDDLMDIRVTWFDTKNNIKQNDKDYEINNIIQYPSLINHNSNCCIM
jgi:hypothetical protein